MVSSLFLKSARICRFSLGLPYVAISPRFLSTDQKSGIIIIQDEKDFKERVIENPNPVIVDFFAGWCGPCKLLGPRLESVMSGYMDKVLLAKVKSVPTVIGLKNGNEHSRFIGLQEKDKIKEFIEKLL